MTAPKIHGLALEKSDQLAIPSRAFAVALYVAYL